MSAHERSRVAASATPVVDRSAVRAIDTEGSLVVGEMAYCNAYLLLLAARQTARPEL
jgi:hypothetical protein